MECGYDYMLKASTGTELLRAQALLARTEMLLGDLLIIAFNEEAAGRFDQLRQIRRRREIGRADLLIASIALAHQAILVTRNVRHFQLIPGLTVVNWVD
ncbi:type II toxin-antitoxin system VapC family toxin [Candidatus Entotheonella palauensis]|uniref:type II toxin-antitoxin system VapC family toxin n=1 Tax=Candidatus Entotheonella palauensis TaxID=93172 RepID=UPI000B7D186C|nr:type II toxin-antitoxin system VapC family toxin [Candidatus Entotheonella palauensis]